MRSRRLTNCEHTDFRMGRTVVHPILRSAQHPPLCSRTAFRHKDLDAPVGAQRPGALTTGSRTRPGAKRSHSRSHVGGWLIPCARRNRSAPEVTRRDSLDGRSLAHNGFVHGSSDIGKLVSARPDTMRAVPVLPDKQAVVGSSPAAPTTSSECPSAPGTVAENRVVRGDGDGGFSASKGSRKGCQAPSGRT